MSTACGLEQTPGTAESSDGAGKLPSILVARGAAERYVGSLLAQCGSIASIFESSSARLGSTSSNLASPQSPSATHFAFSALGGEHAPIEADPASSQSPPTTHFAFSALAGGHAPIDANPAWPQSPPARHVSFSAVEGEDAPVDATIMPELLQPPAALMPDLMPKQTIPPKAPPSNVGFSNAASIAHCLPSSPRWSAGPSPFSGAHNSETMRLKRLMDQSPRKRRARPTSAASRLHVDAPTEGRSVPSRPTSSRRWTRPMQEYSKSVGEQTMLPMTWGAPGPPSASAAAFHKPAALSRAQKSRPCSSLGARGVRASGGTDESAVEVRTRCGVDITRPRSAICAPQHPNPLRGLSPRAAGVGSRSPGGTATRPTIDGAKFGSGPTPSTMPSCVGSGSRPLSSRPHTRTRETCVQPVSFVYTRRRTCKSQEPHVDVCALHEGSDGMRKAAETDARPAEVLNRTKSPQDTPKSEFEVAVSSAFDKARGQGSAVVNEAHDATGCWGLHCIARDQRMHIDDVLLVKSVFDSLDHDRSGTLDLAEFETAVLRLLDLQLKDSSHVPADRVKSISDWCWWNSDRDCDGVIDFQEFIKWYSSNGFSEDLLLTDEERRLRQIARQHGVQPDFVEQIKLCFDSYDKDSSGEVDRAEFGPLLGKLLKVPPNYELPQSRLQYFWAQIDSDNSGKAVFEEFLQWYIKNFGDTSGKDEPRKRMPFEEFYSQVRRIHRRQLDPKIPREKPLKSQ